MEELNATTQYYTLKELILMLPHGAINIDPDLASEVRGARETTKTSLKSNPRDQSKTPKENIFKTSNPKAKEYILAINAKCTETNASTLLSKDGTLQLICTKVNSGFLVRIFSSQSQLPFLIITIEDINNEKMPVELTLNLQNYQGTDNKLHLINNIQIFAIILREHFDINAPKQ